jgi:SAM-dependent methyltransferase
MSMDGSYPSRLRVVDRPHKALWEEGGGRSSGVLEPSGLLVQGPHNVAEFAARLFATEAMNPPASALRRLEEAEPYSLQWFENLETLRHTRQGRWIPRLLEFAKHGSETVVCLGTGLATDGVQYARHGATVVVCSSSSSQLSLARRNFELRGLSGHFSHTSLAALPLESASIDVACVVGALEWAADPAHVIDEVYRVLKPGGKVLAVAPATFDVDYWRRRVFFWLPEARSESKTSALPEQLLATGYSTTRPQRFTASLLRRLFYHFVEHRIHKRHLRRSEVPHVWRWLPLPMLERLLGRVLVLKAFKPLSAALPVLAAAAA